MEKIQKINDVCKEVLTVFAYCNDELIDKIPSKVFRKLNELAADSNANFYIDSEKDLDEQDLSEECKDLISLLYYNFVATESEKSELVKAWSDNENEYQQELRKEYDLDEIFQNRKKEAAKAENSTLPELAMVEYKKEGIFYKIKNFIKKYFKSNK